MARAARRTGMREVPLSEVKDDLSRFSSRGEEARNCYHTARQACRSANRFRVGGRVVRLPPGERSPLLAACRACP